MVDKVTAKVVDFTNVKEGGNFNKRRIPAGDYLATVMKCEDSPSKKDEIFQYLFTIKIKAHSQSSFPYYCKLQDNQLWRLRNLLIAAGLNVPKKRMKLDPSKVVGKVVGVTVEDDEYEGKLQSNISSIFPASELSEGMGAMNDGDDDVSDDDDVEDDTNEEVEDEAEVEEEPAAEDDEFDTMNRLELKTYLRAKDPAIKIFASQSDDDLRNAARLLAPADEEEVEEEESLPPPPKKKAPARKAAAKPVAAVEDEELEELDISDL